AITVPSFGTLECADVWRVCIRCTEDTEPRDSDLLAAHGAVARQQHEPVRFHCPAIPSFRSKHWRPWAKKILTLSWWRTTKQVKMPKPVSLSEMRLASDMDQVASCQDSVQDDCEWFLSLGGQPHAISIVSLIILYFKCSSSCVLHFFFQP
ncbi:unnamed protein product, partial [Ixodes persulcatus]